eukprot:7744630-Pyramimonas_sp.AAC.1
MQRELDHKKPSTRSPTLEPLDANWFLVWVTPSIAKTTSKPKTPRAPWRPAGCVSAWVSTVSTSSASPREGRAAPEGAT